MILLNILYISDFIIFLIRKVRKVGVHGYPLLVTAQAKPQWHAR